MIKKYLLLPLIAALPVLSPIDLAAQHTPGSWTIYPKKGEHFTKVLDTPSMVYYLTGGALYSYDKEYNETKFYTPGSDITETGISKLYYNKDGKYLLIVYEDANMDMLYEDGRLVNMPEIREANLTSMRTINEVAFNHDRIYIATDFGVVVYDENLHQVVESGIYNQVVKHIGATDTHLVISIGNDLYWSPLSERHNSLSKFTKYENFGFQSWQYFSGSTFIYLTSTDANANALTLTFDFNNSIVKATVVTAAPNASEIQPYQDGYYCQTSNGILLFDENGNLISTTAIPSSIGSVDAIGMWKGVNSVWAATVNGIGNYDFTTSTVLSEPYSPDASVMTNAGWMVESPDGLSVYTTSIGMTESRPGGDSAWPFYLPFLLEKYEWSTGSITQEHPYGVTNSDATSKNYQTSLDSKYYYGGPGSTAIDPVDPSFIYHSNNYEGLVVFKDKQRYKIFDKTNSALFTGSGTRVMDAVFDPMGNLWVGHWRGGATGTYPQQTFTPYKILPAEALAKLRADANSVTIDDWLIPNWPSSDPNGKCDEKIIFSHTSNKAINIRGAWSWALIGYDTNGTTTVSDDSSYSYTGLEDQDGTVTNPTFYLSLMEDKNGWIWIGTSSGVFIVKDLTQIGTSSSNGALSVVRPKVARNDGTNYADYLLSTDNIYWMACDASNRKWIATESSGIYLVSEDGTEIIEEFNEDNSPLLSNTVLTVACDPNGNDVLMSTPEGMFVYSSTSAPAADDYSEVYAYPNPVRPDYTGWITVNGLMDKSLVKISDMAGNVFWEGTSEGGMIVWDGCNRDGSRVKSGVYLVYASQNTDGTSGVVTKIVVVN